jgi:prolyl oligopeptidase
MHIAVIALLAASLAYPPARRDSVAEDHFGHQVSEPYRWMENLDAPEVQSWVEAENALTNAELSKLPLREQFRKRLTELWNYERTDVPAREAGQLYFRRNSGLQKQSVLFRLAPGATEPQVVLDPNALFPDGATAVSGFRVSPDGHWLAYSTAAGGSDLLDIHLRDLRTGKDLGEVVPRAKFSEVHWTHDSKGFLYARFKGTEKDVAFADANKFHQIWHHVIGRAQDALVFERADAPGDFVGSDITDDGRFLILDSFSGTNNNRVWVANLGPAGTKLDAKRTAIAADEDSFNGVLGDAKGRIYLRTNYLAPNFRIVSMVPGDSDRSHWKTVIPEGKEPIHQALLVSGRIVVNRLTDVQAKLDMYDLSGKSLGEVALPEAGSVDSLSARNDDPDFFFSFTSYLRPRSVFRYHLKSGKLTAFATPKTSFDPSKYETRAVFYPSKDGTRVPLFITLRKDAKLDGQNPTLLYAYGGFDIAITPAFSATAAAWLDAGGIYAVANLRGGSEYGEAWHHAGMREKKQTVFDDFISAAEFLIGEKYTSPKKLAVHGRSNGGLLIGAVMTQRPDLFGVALPTVGVMDMLRFQKFTGGALWIEEYGSPEDDKMFAPIFAYSPLHNLKAGTCYPPTMVTTADRDDRVVPSHSFKFAAALQAAQGCDNPTLIRIEKAGSHAYRPTDRIINEAADQLAFAMSHLQTPAAVAPHTGR